MNEETAYTEGLRTAWTIMLQECMIALDYDDAATHAAWVVEREHAIVALRRLCERCGDNAWEPNVPLAQIIERHLGAYLPGD